MPTALGFLLFAGPLGGIFSFGTLVAVSQVAIGLGISLAVQLAFKPKVPSAPKPEDGRYNLRQNVPSLVVILGRVKKASDYDLLEEKAGIAYHVLVPAAHRIAGFVKHYLHDEEATLDGAGIVVTPDHFNEKVTIQTRLGLNAETAYASLITALPTIWTADHRGDGLASVLMSCKSVAADKYQKTYTQQMPSHSSEIEGALVYDPREIAQDPDDPDSWTFSTNLALLRLFHLTHPSGGKMTFDDMHLPDWIAAANVCDEGVTNRAGESENRYHGGMWYRYENDPVEVGRVMDQAAELVLYETDQGKVGVHAGRFVEPDIRLTEADILSVTFDANRRKNANVLAVRGRFTDPNKLYNTVDAAIYGNPYVGDSSERSKTVENVAVQSHNHMQRLQKIAFQRANAPRVQVLCHYEPAKQVPYRRFIRVHYPPKLTEAVIEITGRPQLSLRNLTYSVEGIVVSGTLYDFDGLTEEGEPPADIVEVEKDDIPVPAGFDVAIQTEVISGGSTAAYGLATWTAQDEELTVEVEWQPTVGGTIRSIQTKSGDVDLRTSYLADGEEYRFRASNWSGGVQSEWTDYEIRTATSDPVPPGVATGVSATGGVGDVTFNWTAPNSANYRAARLYLNTVSDFGTATLVGAEYGTANDVESRIVSSVSAGGYFGWIEAINASGTPAAPVATGAITVT
ncbi:hypothetical protein OHD62_17285 [Mesorhizobium sp. YC-39]|uniref:hypothetical protein n=1 Tax=unclassified Mesorhizobium TaxID=325217 RepID=UPI0021E6FA81|nr:MULTISPECIES: hypothetical protein [unclassified Mesorhizobium]MCV3209597.1 hypothetical protein [Mesorhizobium sp. YC-2]MCV3230127.1 hypothetical protein [Mesorhizobium sp. YC-39]